jgi:hypothetical protein
MVPYSSKTKSADFLVTVVTINKNQPCPHATIFCISNNFTYSDLRQMQLLT